MKSKTSDKQAVKYFFVFTGLLVLLIATFLYSVRSGSVEITWADLWAAFTNSSKDQSIHDIIWNIRLPRSLVAMLVGANLAVSGAILQGVMRNPLADPQIIGISSGAGFAGMIIIILFPDMPGLRVPVAFIGALIAAILVYALAWKGGIRPERIILSGVAITAFIGAGISAIMTFYSDLVQGTVGFMVGGLTAKSWPQFEVLFPYSIVGLLLAVVAIRQMNLLMLGDDTARSLGTRVELTRFVLIAISTFLAASAVSIVGLLGFVGLIVPHITRMILGSDYKVLIPGSILIGAFIVLFSDTLSRTLFPPYEVPVGVMMGAIGAPFFLYLLRRRI